MATSGPRYPTTISTVLVNGTDVDWVAPGNIGADDGVNASITTSGYDTGDFSYRLKAQNFGFSIPGGSVINGITVEIKKSDGGIGSGEDQEVQLLDAAGSIVGTNKAVVGSWPNTPTISTYGGVADTWAATPTVAMVNDPDFGVVLTVEALQGNTDIFVDYIRVTITYTAGGTSVTVNPGRGQVVLTGLQPTISVTGANPVYQAQGAAVHGTGDVSPAWPAHAVNDIGLCFVESADEAVTTPAGWAQTAFSPQGQRVNGDTRITVFWRRATSTSMAAPTLVDPGNHLVAQILTFRGCATSGDPWDTASGGTYTDGGVAFGLLAGATTAADHCLIVAVIVTGIDTTSPQTSDWTNTNLSALTERTAQWFDDGNGGGFAVATGVKAAHGAYGTTTVSLASLARYAYITLALRPPDSGGGGGDPAVGHRYWRLLLRNNPGAGPVVNEVELVERVGTPGQPGSDWTTPATMHPGITHIRPVIVANWNNGANPDGEFDIDVAMLSLPAGYVPTLPGDRVTREVDTLFDSDGILKPSVRQFDGATALPLVKGIISGTGSHGDVISFADYGRTFQTTPRVRFSGGLTHEPRSVWGTAAQIDAGSGNTAAFDSAKGVEDNCAARDGDESGFTIQARLRQRSGTAALRDLGFNGTHLTEVDETDAINTLTNAPANDDRYRIRGEAQAELRSRNGQPYSVTFNYVIETTFDAGGAWQIRSNGAVRFETQSTSYVSLNAGLLEHVIVVAGLTADGSDRIRWRLTSIHQEGLGDYTDANSYVAASTLTTPGSGGLHFLTGTDSFANKAPSGVPVDWEAVGYL